MQLITLNQVSILEQLRIEEALLRADSGNWSLINSGASPAIVMGISGKPTELVNLDLVQRDRIPLIKRFSGGGTVYIDPNTVFVTFICNTDLPIYSRSIFQWAEKVYQPLFAPLPFRQMEHDYVVGKHKCGGNAQYIQKGRWLHHTSFLWDFTSKKMDYLLLPKKRPRYRQNRSHEEFLCRLRPHFPHKESFIEKIQTHLRRTLSAKTVTLEEIQPILKRPHRRATISLDLQEPPPDS